MTGAAGNDVATVKLPDRLNSAAAGDVHSIVQGHLGQGLVLDAAEVAMLGAQCLQILIAAQRAWAVQGMTFEVRNLPVEVRESLGIMGISAEQIGAGEMPNGA